MKKMTVQQARLMRAVLLLGVGLALLLLVPSPREGSEGTAGPPLLSGRAFADAIVSGDGREGGSGDAVGALDAAVGRGSGEVPPWFAEEVLPLEGVGEIRALDDWSVVGFSAETDVATVREWARSELESRGWTLMETGTEMYLTGIKEGGRCSWVALSCTQVGDEVSIVVQVPVA